jgi:hypothetical protein
MFDTVKNAIVPATPFFKMFALLFGQTLASFFCVLITLFYSFHIWLMLKAMTTIEFCEKSMKRTSYDSSIYDRGVSGNIRAVLGDDPIFWLLPCSPPSGDGLSFWTEESPMRLSTDMEVGRDIRPHVMPAASASSSLMPNPKAPEVATGKKQKVKGPEAGTGECADSD